MIYSASKLSPNIILTKKVKEGFDINIDERNLVFVSLDENITNLLNPKNYPSFTFFW